MAGNANNPKILYHSDLFGESDKHGNDRTRANDVADSSNRTACPVGCGQSFTRRGLGHHIKACERKAREAETDREYERKVLAEASSPSVNTLEPVKEEELMPWERSLPPQRNSRSMPVEGNCKVDSANLNAASNTASSTGHNSPSPTAIPIFGNDIDPLDPPRDAIKTEYHPNSSRPTKIDRFEDYREYDKSTNKPPPLASPWTPFPTQSDFELSALIHEACLNKRQITCLFEIFNRCQSGKDSLTITSYTRLQEIWEQAASLLTPFQTAVIRPSYKHIQNTYEIHYRSMWDWAMDLVSDPLLAPYFEWDAQRLYKYNGTKFERFLHEPWTGNRFWDVQSKLPPGGKPFGFIIYADKTKLSSFGTKKGYPVFARLANLHPSARNSRGYGGGRLVGWLPIVEDNQHEKSTTDYVNFKNIVWHESFRKFLECIKDYSYTGYAKTCGDGIIRDLFPFVFALSADYEEQCIMACIRGLRALCPCPTCKVLRELQAEFLKMWPARNMDDMREIIERAAALKKKNLHAQAENLLKENGLRDIDNAFWEIRFSDPHKALSFDHMHNYPHGLGGKHFWKQLQAYITELGSEAAKTVDIQASQFPRWRNFGHFTQVMGIHFTDAMKLQDIVKISPFITHNLLTPTSSPSGYLLLCCIRSYLMVDSYFLMDVHTEGTIAEGREELKKFGKNMKNYIEATRDENAKNWNIPKMHLHSHGFDEILDKGIQLNYDSLLNEPLHSSLKDSYLLRTNFKEVEGQILKADHRTFVSQFIRQLIDYADEVENGSADKNELLDEEQVHNPQYEFNNVVLGAPRNYTIVGKLLECETGNQQYERFITKLEGFLSVELPDLSPNLLKIHTTTKIKEFRFMKVAYESWVSWRMKTDYLRCSPKFNHEPRYDCIIVNTSQGVIFAQLVFIFIIQISGQQYPIALIQPFKRARTTGTQSKKDKDLRFLRLHKEKDSKTDFIFVRSIIRGVVLVPAQDNPEDYIVFDVCDSDIMLRVKEILRQ